jgi:hypothetical protein
LYSLPKWYLSHVLFFTPTNIIINVPSSHLKPVGFY